MPQDKHQPHGMSMRAQRMTKLVELLQAKYGPGALDASVVQLEHASRRLQRGTSSAPATRRAAVACVTDARFNASKERREYLLSWEAGGTTWEPYSKLLLRTAEGTVVSAELDAQVCSIQVAFCGLRSWHFAPHAIFGTQVALLDKLSPAEMDTFTSDQADTSEVQSISHQSYGHHLHV